MIGQTAAAAGLLADGPHLQLNRTVVCDVRGAARPVKPFLLASHPVALEFLAGDLVAIGAAAAFARIGEAPLWLVVLAGGIGMVKFDWLTWWAGRRWGAGMMRMVGATRERAQRYADRAAGLNPWILRLAVDAAFLPGVPAPIVFAMAGLAGMRVLTFLVLDLTGALLITAVVTALGWAWTIRGRSGAGHRRLRGLGQPDAHRHRGTHPLAPRAVTAADRGNSHQRSTFTTRKLTGLA